MSLCDLKIGESGYVTKINCNDDIRVRLYDLGLIEGTNIKLILISNGINAYLIKNSLIAIRNKDALNIIVGEVND